MIKIEMNNDGKKTKGECEMHIKGFKNAVQEFYGVIKVLTDCDENVFLVALGKIMEEKLEGDDDDESES